MEAATTRSPGEQQAAERKAREAKPDDPELEGEGEGEQADDEPQGVVVPGSEEQLSLAVGGGGKPSESTILLAGGELTARGQWKKGERVRFMVEGTIDEVAIRDNRDRKLNIVTSTKRKHTMTIEHIEGLPAAQD